jgi:hypothetical protein
MFIRNNNRPNSVCVAAGDKLQGRFEKIMGYNPIFKAVNRIGKQQKWIFRTRNGIKISIF